jgi:flavin reductase (DIM6/NTAB) family NADH-FMN oxidoreductase RutF
MMAEKREVALRDALRLIAPGPATLLTTMYRDHPNLMTASWLQPLSLEPTLIGVAVQPARLTHEFITKTDVFAVNIPTIDLLSAVHLCGFRSGREGDKFEAAKLTPADAGEIDAPLVGECVAHIECSVLDRQTIGDHDLFVGRVLRVTASDEAFDTFWKVDTDAGQLLHHLGADRYAGLSRAYTATLPAEED